MSHKNNKYFSNATSIQAFQGLAIISDKKMGQSSISNLKKKTTKMFLTMFQSLSRFARVCSNPFNYFAKSEQIYINNTLMSYCC